MKLRIISWNVRGETDSERGRDIEELKIGKIFRLGGGLVFWDKRVYEPTSKREREGLWAKLGAIKGLWEDLYCVGSDFNKVRFSWERNSKIDDGGIRGGSIPFRIGNIRLAVKGFKESHKGWWVGYNFRGSNSLILASKFKTLESDLKAWSKEDF
ncbi:hypothetical protein CK203_008550 [Vitis vinifera]|uniref:Endonuclease/exonuclease/phosphatase domain-containing protein n=1 Tax=Vitis vinifera TaxID=29760 RepID=A0A438KDP1_VITVI|nr:hypothetical protein CK203_008550 [Vitis vinifera]